MGARVQVCLGTAEGIDIASIFHSASPQEVVAAPFSPEMANEGAGRKPPKNVTAHSRSVIPGDVPANSKVTNGAVGLGSERLTQGRHTLPSLGRLALGMPL